WLVPADALHTTLGITATGETSGRVAENTFTDGSKTFTATISPTTDAAGHTGSSYTITITNTDTLRKSFSSIRITVPTGYTSGVVGAAGGPSGWTSTPTQGTAFTGGSIITISGGGQNKLQDGQSVSITFTITAPTTVGTYTWTTSTGGGFTITGGQPTVTISKPTTTTTVTS